VGPHVGSWYGVQDIRDDGCKKIGIVLQIQDDEVRIFLLGNGFRVSRVWIA
jgi:hypothetical protein